MKNFIIFFILCVTATGLIAKENPETETPILKAPIQDLGENYSIFPENKAGNSLYLKRKKIFTRQDLNLRAILVTKEGLVHMGLNEQSQPVMGWYGKTVGKVTNLKDGFFQLAVGNKKKLLRVGKEGTIQDLLPKSNTPGGLVYNGQNKAAFSHIASGEAVEEGGKTKYLYTFRVHIVSKDQKNIRTLPKRYTSYNFNLDYSWIKPNVLEIKYGDGEVDQLKL
ncbi:MAG: hypothetical protein QNL04_14500 [SAR324 cluster bacterium]|nr:hypothetical protein [SAR324 cluster bacterium]